jgi:hypothetical protein
MAWNKLKSPGFKLADKFQNLGIKKDVLESCVFPVPYTAPKRGHSWRRK